MELLTPFNLYVILTLDSVRCFLGFVSCVLAISGLFCLIGVFVEEDSSTVAGLRKALIWILCFLVPLSILAVLLPTTRNALIIFGVPAAINSDAAKKLGGISKDALDLLHNKIREELKEQVSKEVTK